MSMPFIIPGFGTRERAITDIIESTALQKTALAHILNAEGEKIQAAIIRPGVTVDKLLDVNDSVQAMIYGITRLELILEAKLAILSDLSLIDTALPPIPAPLVPLVPAQVNSTDSDDKSNSNNNSASNDSNNDNITANSSTSNR
ncbi:hypothetical protein [Anaerocolumna sp. MB42-C2]|uniref:hypothetical protein n=1 Tax=Anaerocolumna sp. MB42-C2 TaxID=3070997 RepID=UPI0027DF6F39|nr:hypothetical protein [Anaerocolumna sp. MB42-C2]WMJ86550.1 hypothetical protein RBU59_21295 [Anaerocolumna sp. MB42-C2]